MGSDGMGGMLGIPVTHVEEQFTLRASHSASSVPMYICTTVSM